jgi:hypothetical protein
VLEFALGFFAFRDIFMHRDPAAAFDRLVDDVDDAAVVQFNVEREGLAFLERSAQLVIITTRLKREGASSDACVEQIADGGAAPNAPRIDIVHGPVPFVPDQQPILRIEHAQALNHIVERAVEPHVLLAELAPDAPGRERADHADAEQRAGHRRRCNRQRGQRHRNRIDDFHHNQRDGKAEHAGKNDHLPVAVPAQISQFPEHGSTFGPLAAQPNDPRFSTIYADWLWNRVKFHGPQ